METLTQGELTALVIAVAASLVTLMVCLFAAYINYNKKHERQLLERLAESEKYRIKTSQEVTYERAKDLAWEYLIQSFGTIATIDRYCKQYESYTPKYLKSVFSPHNKEESPKAIQTILDNLKPEEKIVIAS